MIRVTTLMHMASGGVLFWFLRALGAAVIRVALRDRIDKVREMVEHIEHSGPVMKVVQQMVQQTVGRFLRVYN